MFASNPLLHRPGAGSASPGEARSEGTYTDHIPTVEAVVLVIAAAGLFAAKKAGFDVGLRVKAGG